LRHYDHAEALVKENCIELGEKWHSVGSGPAARNPEVAVEIRRAEIRDAEAITVLINSAFRKAESFFIERDRIDVASIRTLMEKGQFLVADGNGALAGCVYVEKRSERAYLGLLSVEPTLQKGGIGSILMNAAEEYCAKAGCRFMDLRIVNLRTENHAFYSRRGYVETGTEPFPSELTTKLPCHFVNMSKPLP
jgi:N-acetylglutamate synthase-like GNAT family acetyltransferase